MIPKTSKDWTEDFTHENGNYINTCVDCRESFWGHKRRVVCKECNSPRIFTREDIINALHKAELKHNKDYSKIWAIMEDALSTQMSNTPIY